MKDCFGPSLTDGELKGLSSLALAHVGDAVYELMVRSFLCSEGNASARKLHNSAVRYVSAPSQARSIGAIEKLLSAEEFSVYKRGRNARVNSIPRGATLSEYHAATGLEALFGWLYLKGETARLGELFAAIIGETDGK